MADPNYPFEEWRTIESAPDYAISSLGRVKRIVPDWQGKYLGRVLKPSTGRGGYLYHVLCVKGRHITRKVHRMVCEAFHGPCPPDKDLCAHWDGDASNNHLGNLRWATYSENAKDRTRHGRSGGKRINTENWLRGDRHWTRTHPEKVLRGDKHPRRIRPEIVPRGAAVYSAKLSEEQAIAIIAAPHYHGVGRDLAARHGVSMGLVTAIRKGRAWAHLPRPE